MILFEGAAAKSLPDTASRRTGAIYKNLSFHLGAGCHAIGGAATDPSAARLLLDLAAGLVRPSGGKVTVLSQVCLLYTSPSPRDRTRSRMPSSA